MNQQKSLANQVWTTLSQINVSKNIEKKGNLSYLSWTWAWQTMMEHYPQATYEITEKTFADSSMEVQVVMRIEDGDQSVERMMWLPVMDYKNKAIANPDSFAINTAKMRCLTKCLAMYGLGIYIYAGEDIPQAEKEALTKPLTKEQEITLSDLIKETATDTKKFLRFYEIDQLNNMKQNMYQQAFAMLRRKLEEAERSESKAGAIADEDL
tara:strand:+ start:176 stop:805 length:630 start_codon:yes stop_codon:yes gene_type:complete